MIRLGAKNTSIKLQKIFISKTIVKTCKYLFIELRKFISCLLNKYLNNLIERVWNDEESADDNTLNVHISRIRNKLKEANPKEEYIETVWSIGYKLKK